MVSPRKTPTKIAPFDAGKGHIRVSTVPGGDGIQVAIRMRPMNNKESEGRRVWRVLQKYNSITQTTPHGKPLPDRASGKTFFTFDKIFGEDSTTTQIYNDVVKKIVNSAVSGLNGTIFAYGQTSSGKTFTMSGGGLRQPEVHGIIQMAGKDIFSKIAAHPCRVFLLRVSFIEIYNEEVRDLLVSGVAQGSGAKLAIREDPRRGFFVNANETFVTDLETLISVMSAGEKNRAVGSTAMNERSSRSHTIFRITLESRKRKTASDEDGVSDYEDEGKSDRTSLQDDDDDGTVLVSTLSLVDLAGSESVRHTGATGERQKEGGRINQSLLTLSRVIASLGQPGSAHVNFRDSKLTRILQPSLSGNAHMAVICCATPSELYLEETRSTLQFASRAKLVKTKPQVNEVLDDSSLIKRLQHELAETRKLVKGKEHLQHMEHLQQVAQNAAREAEIKLCRLKACFLRGGFLPDTLVGDYSLVANNAKQKKRRHSDVSSGGVMEDQVMQMTPKHSITKVSKTLSTGYVCDDLIPGKENGKAGSQSAEAELLKDALHAKGQKTQGLNHEISSLFSKLEKAKQELASTNDQNWRLKSMNEAAEAKNKTLEAARDFIQAEFDKIIKERNEYQKQPEAHFQSYMKAKDIEIENIMEELLTVREEKKAAESNLLQAVADIDESRNCALEKENELAKTKKENENLLHKIAQIQEIKNSITADRDNSVKKLEAERIEKNERMYLMENQISSLLKENESMIQKVKTLEMQLIQAASHTEEKSKNLAILEEELDRLKYEHKTLTEEVLKLKSKNECSEAELKRTIGDLDEEKNVLAESKVQLDFELKRATEDNGNIRLNLEERKEETENKIYQVQNQLQESEALVGHSSHEMIRLKEELNASYIKNKALIQEYSELKAKNNSAKVQFQDVVKMLKEEKMTLIEAKKKVEDQLNASTENLNNVTKVTARMTQQVEELQAELSQIAAKAAEKSRKLCETEAELERVTSANKHLLEEVIDLKDTKKCAEEKLEHSVKILEEEKLALSESKAKIEYELKCSTEEYRSICVQLEEHKVKSGHEIDHIQSQLQEYEGLVAENRNENARIREDLAQSFLKYQTLLQQCSDLRTAKESSEAQFQDAIRTLEAEKTEFNKVKKQLEEQLKSSIESYHRVTLQLQCTEEASKVETEALQSKLLESNAFVEENRNLAANLRKELAQVAAKHEVLLEENSHFRTNIQCLTDEMDRSISRLEAERSVLQERIFHNEEQLNAFIGEKARMAQQVEELEAELLQSAAKADENLDKIVETEAELERLTSANKILLAEVIDLKEKNVLSEAKLEHSVKILDEEKLALSESKANIEYDLKRATEEYRIIFAQLEEHKVKSGHEIDHIQSQLQEYEGLVADNKNENARIKDELTMSLLKYETLLQECSDQRVAKEFTEAQFQDAIRTLEAEKTELNAAKKLVEEQLKSSIESYQRVTLQLQCTEEASKLEIEAIQLKLLESNALVEENRNLAASLRKELTQVASKHDALLEENSHFRIDIQCLTDKMSLTTKSLEAEKRVLQERIIHNEEQLNAFVGEKARMAQQVVEPKSSIQPKYPGRGTQMYITGIASHNIKIEEHLKHLTGDENSQGSCLRNYGFVLLANGGIEMQLQWRTNKPCQSVAKWLLGETQFEHVPSKKILTSITSLMLNGSCNGKNLDGILAKENWERLKAMDGFVCRHPTLITPGGRKERTI